MKTENVTLKILGGAIAIFTISTIVSISVVVGAYYFQDRMRREHNQANAAFQSISNRYLAIDEEEKLVRSHLPDFVSLYQRGIIGDEQRLNWIETLRAVGDSLNLPALSYQIESRQSYTPPFPLTLGRFKINGSKMMLTMQLLHEGDLFRILGTLDEQAKGSYTITSCTLGQLSAGISENSTTSNVSARCELLWLTITLSDGTPIKV